MPLLRAYESTDKQDKRGAPISRTGGEMDEGFRGVTVSWYFGGDRVRFRAGAERIEKHSVDRQTECSAL